MVATCFRQFSLFDLFFLLSSKPSTLKKKKKKLEKQLFTASELQLARGEELAFVRRAFPLLRRWGAFTGRVAELDAEAARGDEEEEEEEREQREKNEQAATEEGKEQEATEQGGPSPSPSSSSSRLLLLPSELLWRDLRATFPNSLEEFGSLADFNAGVLAWARVLEEEVPAALGVSSAVGFGGGSSEDDEGRQQQRAVAASSSSAAPPDSPPPPRRSSSLTSALVSAARASRDLGVRARVKAALRVRRQPPQRQRRRLREEDDDNNGRQTPTLASPSPPDHRAPKLARAAWRDQRAMLVLYALAAIGDLPEAEHDEALAALLLKKLSDLPGPSAGKR